MIDYFIWLLSMICAVELSYHMASTIWLTWGDWFHMSHINFIKILKSLITKIKPGDDPIPISGFAWANHKPTHYLGYFIVNKKHKSRQFWLCLRYQAIFSMAWYRHFMCNCFLHFVLSVHWSKKYPRLKLTRR